MTTSGNTQRPFASGITWSLRVVSPSVSKGTGTWSYDFRSPTSLNASFSIGSGSFTINRGATDQYFDLTFASGSAGLIGSATASVQVFVAGLGSPASQNSAPTISGSGEARSYIYFSGGSYSNASSVTTELVVAVSSGNLSGGGGSVKTSSSPYQITDNDAASPAYYFATRDTVVGTDGNTQYFYSGQILSYPYTPPIVYYSYYFNGQGADAVSQNYNPVGPLASGTVIYLADASRAGYVFNGWYTGPNATGTYLGNSNNQLTMGTYGDGATFYASWTLSLPSFTDQTVASPAKLGVSYSDGVSASNAASYSVYSGALPNGLSLNTSTGAITGTPTAQGTFNFVVRATSSASGTADTSTLTIVVAPPGKRMTGSSTSTALTVGKRYTGSAWVDLTTMKRFDGTNWVNIQS
jgi:uncharacterized repeat protein (TIGR02543 family)